MTAKIIILASGTATGGGSGARKLREHFNLNHPHAQIVGIVSNHADGGVAKLARERQIPFLHISNKDLTPEMYGRIPMHFGAPRAFVLLSGWIRFVHTKQIGKWGAILDKMDRNPGLDPRRTINIHPALLSQLGGRFGGSGMWGHHVHEAVKKALDAGELDVIGRRMSAAADTSDKKATPEMVSREVRTAYSGFTMHFVIGRNGPADYDRGPVFAEIRTPIAHGMSADAIGSAVNTLEQRWQSLLSEMVVRGQIRLLDDGTVSVPFGYGLLPKQPVRAEQCPALL